MQLIFFASSFCDPCIHTRAVLHQVSKLLPQVKIAELDVVRDEEEARKADVRLAPTIIVLNAAGEETFRAEGEPTLNQVLTALATAV